MGGSPPSAAAAAANESAMIPPQYCLKWNNYSASVTSTFRSILAGEDFVDVTLVSSAGDSLKAHRVVLAACSVYFRDILKGLNLWQHPVIVLKDVPFTDLQGIVEFIYHGEVSVDQEALPSLLKSAQILKVRGLTEEDPPPPMKEEEASKPSSSHHHSRKSSHPIQIKPPSQKRPFSDETDISSSPKKPANHGGMSDEEPSESATAKEMEEEIDDDEDGGGEEDEIDGSQILQTGGKDSLTGPYSLDGDSISQIMGLSKNMTPNSLTQKKTCPYCFQQLSWHALSRHIRDMHRQQSNFVTCKYCMKMFRNKNSLGCHMWRFHKDTRDKDNQNTASSTEVAAPVASSSSSSSTSKVENKT